MDDSDNVPQRTAQHHIQGEPPLLDPNSHFGLPHHFPEFPHQSLSSLQRHLPFDPGRLGITPPRIPDFPPQEDSLDQYLTEESPDPRLFDQDYIPDIDDYSNFPGPSSSIYGQSPSRSFSRPLGLYHSPPTRGDKFSELPLFIQKRGPGRPRKDGQSPLPKKPGSRPRGRGRGRGSSYQNQNLTYRQAFPLTGMSTPLLSGGDFLESGGSLSNLGPSSSQSSFPGDLSGFDLPPVLTETGLVIRDMSLMDPEEDLGSRNICAFCGCGEKSLLGQGKLTLYEPTPGYDVFVNVLHRERSSSDVEKDLNRALKQHPTFRRMRGPTKGCRERSRSPRQLSEDELTSHVIDELSLVGFHEGVELVNVFEPSGQLYAHEGCALWSIKLGVTRGEDGLTLLHVDKAVFAGLTHNCNYCNRFGASIQCCTSDCGLFYHYPCAAAGGSYQDYSTLSLWCPQHLQQAENIPSAVCVQCATVGNVGEQLFCTSCGMHYHGTCLCPAVEVKAIVRAGWQCPNCKICQTCRHPGEDSKMLVCDTCDKGYHTFCLKPAMTTIPKNGWKCKNCRVCSDCGARTPGNGPSSRWHLNYSVCDSCYQQRNKGLCCPLCGKAYRHFHNKTMVPCNKCKKYVHSECDITIDATTLQKLRDGQPTDYVCTVCIEQEQEQQMELGPFPLPLPEEESLETFEPLKDPVTESLIIKEESFLSESTSMLTASSQESLYDEDSSMDFDFSMIDQGLSPAHPPSFPAAPAPPQGGKGHGGKGKLIDRGKLKAAGKKKLSSSQKRGQSFSEKRRNRSEPIQYGEKRRGPKVKIKLGGGTPTSQIITTGSCKDDKSEDSGDDHPTTITLCSAKDTFTLDQDVCKSCGAFGRDEESKLISCTQCGQCYHPYCANVKVTKVILLKGWRCLDCTVCEGCGKPDDEGRLLLCDDCDISYHTYCLKPPLEHVPKGNWKCKWCVSCLNCGATTPGFGCNWKNNYTQCGPCASKVICPACRRSYQQEELILQCVQCDRWLHAQCDGLKNEDEAELAADYGYHCLYCRPKTGHDGPLPPPPPPPPPEPKEIKPPSPPPQPKEPEPPRKFLVDGVYLYAAGMQVVESLAIHMPRKPVVRRGRGGGASGVNRHPNVARLLSMSSQDGDESFDKDTDDMEGTEGSLTSPPILPPSQEPGLIGGPPETPLVEYNEDGTIKKVRKKRQIRRQIGVGGFIPRAKHRTSAAYKRQNSIDQDPTQTTLAEDGSIIPGAEPGFKRQRKPRKSKRTHLEESFPPYLREAFFGRDVLDSAKDNKDPLVNSEQDQEKFRVMSPCPLNLDGGPSISLSSGLIGRPQLVTTPSLASTEHSDDIQNLDEGDLKDILPDIHQDDDFFNMLDEGLKAQDLDIGGSKTSSTDNLDNLLDPNLDEKNIDVDQILSEGLIHMDSSEVANILGDNIQQNQGLHGQPSSSVGLLKTAHPSGGMPQLTGMGQSLSNVGHPRMPGMGLGSPLHSPLGGDMPRPMGPGAGMPGMPPDVGAGFPPGMPPPPYGPQGFNPNFNPQGMAGQFAGDPSMWMDDGDASGFGSSRRNILKWEADEKLDKNATISSILYVNTNYPTLIQDYPDWPERAKQIAKLWRKLSHDEKAPYLAQARKNRTSSRVQKAQRQVTQELKRRQEAQMKHDSEVMPPPPAPPPLHSPGQSVGLEHMVPGHPGLPPQGMSPRGDLNSPLSPNRPVLPGTPGDGQSPLQSPLHSPGTMNIPPIWNDEGPGPSGSEQASPTPGLQRQLSNPDPYSFPPPSPRLDGMGATRPLSHPPRMIPPLYQPVGLQRQSCIESDPYSRAPRTPGAIGPRMPPPSQDPYAFPPSTSRAQSIDEQSKPGDATSSLPPDLAGVHASLPEALSSPAPGTDPFSQPPMTPKPDRPTESAADPFSQPPTPSSTASDPLNQQPMTPRPAQDPYAHPPGTPRAPGPPEGFMQAQQSPRHDPYAQQPMTPRSSVGMGSPLHSPTSRQPGPLRHPDPSQPQFRHHLARSQSMPDPYSSQPGTPHPMMGSPMSRAMTVAGGEVGMPQYRPAGRPPFPETSVLQQLIGRRQTLYPPGVWPLSHNPHFLIGPDGMPVDANMAGGVNPQHLRERLAQQTKQRQIRKQIEDREKMIQMGAPPAGWPHPDGGSPRHPGMGRMPGPRPPPFTDPSTGKPLSQEQWMNQRMVRPPHPGQFPPDSEGFHPRMQGQFPDGMRPGFPPQMRMGRPPGPGAMPRPFPPPGDGSQPVSQDPMAERRAQYLNMIRLQKAQQAAAAHGQIPGPIGQGPSMGMPQIGPQQAPSEELQPLPEIPAADIPLPESTPSNSEDDVFQSTSNLKATIPADQSEEVSDIHLADIEPKENKPSQSSEDDKHDILDEDLLNDDGTFDILKYTDPELAKILGEDETNLLDDFMDDPKPKEETKEEDLNKPEVKEEEKKPETDEKPEAKPEDEKSSESKDFQQKFLEFSQKRQDSTEENKPGTPKPGEKTKGPVGVSHIAALLQGTKPVERGIDKAEAEKQEIQNLAGTVEALRKDMEARQGIHSPMGQRPHFGPGMASPLHHVTSPHQSPSIGIPSQNPEVGGLQSPKFLPSPRSGQPSPRTPGMQSPFGPIHGPVLSPMNPDLSFPPGSNQPPFSPPVPSNPLSPYPSSNPLSPYPSSNSGPHSPFPQLGPNVSQPPYGLPGQVPYGSPSHTVSQATTQGTTFPMQHASRATITPTNQYTQGTYGQPYMPPRGGTLTPSPNSILYGQSAAAQHAIRGPGPGMRPPFSAMDPSQDPKAMYSQAPGMSSQAPQQLTSPTMDSRPQNMIKKIQQGLMEMGKGPTPPEGMSPTHSQSFFRPERPQGQGHRPMMLMRPGSPRFSTGGQRLPPPGMRMSVPRQQTPGSPGFPGVPPGVGLRMRSSPPGFPLPPGIRPGMFPPGSQQQTLLDELVEEEKKEQKRQAEQQAIARRDGMPITEGMMGVGPRPTGPGIPVGPRMEQRMSTPEQGPSSQPLDVMAQQFGQFPVRPPSGMSPRTPSPFGAHSPGIQQPPMNPMAAMMAPQPPPTPPSDMPLDDQQRIPYEDWLIKQGQFLEMQVKIFEQSTQKQKRAKRSIQARQRQARKVGNELNPADLVELERISTEQAGLQKQLDHFRKQFRNHQSLVQDYKDKQKEQFGRNWQPIMPPGHIPAPGQMSPGSRMAAPSRMPTPQRFQGPRGPPSTRGPRGPGANSVRMSPSARQEYETYMQSRLRMATPGIVNPNVPPIPKPPTAMTVVADNNPFSEAFQERENMEKFKADTGVPAIPAEMMRPFDPSQHPPPPYPDSGPMYPRIPGQQMGDPRFSGFNPMHQGFGIPPSNLPPEMGSKDKPKKRRKKKKGEELENAQSQPLPPSLPNQAALLGQLGSQSGPPPPVSKPEFPVKPHSETERRILEILSNTAALAQQKSSASSHETTSSSSTSTITTTAQSPVASTSVTSSSQTSTATAASSQGPPPTHPDSSTELTQSPFGQMPGSRLPGPLGPTGGPPPHFIGPHGPGVPPHFRQGAPIPRPGMPPAHPGGPHPGPHPRLHGPFPPVSASHGLHLPTVPQGQARLPPPEPNMTGPHHPAVSPQPAQVPPSPQQQHKLVQPGGSVEQEKCVAPESEKSTVESPTVSSSPNTQMSSPAETSQTESKAQDESKETDKTSKETANIEDSKSAEKQTESSETADKSPPKKPVCDDGIHCGTDDEDDDAEPNIPDPEKGAEPQTQEIQADVEAAAQTGGVADQEESMETNEADKPSESNLQDTVSSETEKEKSIDTSLEMDESQATVVTGTLQNVTLSASEELPLPQPCIISSQSSSVTSGEIISVTTSNNQITVHAIHDSTPGTTVTAESNTTPEALVVSAEDEPKENEGSTTQETSAFVKTEPDADKTPQGKDASNVEKSAADCAQDASNAPPVISEEPRIKEEPGNSFAPSCKHQKMETGESKDLNKSTDGEQRSESSATSTAVIQPSISESETNVGATAVPRSTEMPTVASQQPSSIPSTQQVLPPSGVMTSSPGLPGALGPGHLPPPPYPQSSGYPGPLTHLPPGSISNPQMPGARPGVPTSVPHMPPSVSTGYVRGTVPPGMRPGMDQALGPRINPRMFPGGGDPRMMRMRMDPRMFRGQDPSQFRHGFDPRFMRPGMMPPGMDPRMPPGMDPRMPPGMDPRMPPGMDPRQFRPRMGHPGFDQTMMRPGMDPRMMMRPPSQDSDQPPQIQERYHLRNPLDPQQMQFRQPGMDPNMIRQMLGQQPGAIPRGPRPMMNLDPASGHLTHPVSSSELPTSVAQSLAGQVRPQYPGPRQAGPHVMPHSTLPSNMSDHHRQMLAQQDAGSQKIVTSSAHHFTPGHRPPLSVSMPHGIPSSMAGPHPGFQHRPPAPGLLASSMSPTGFPHGPHPHQMPGSFPGLPLHQTSEAVSNLEHFVSSASMPSAISNQASSSTTSTPSPHLTSPASSTSPAIMNIKQEPGTDARLLEMVSEDMEGGEQRPSQNVLLKQLLASSSARNLSQAVRSETPSSQGTDDALPELTPEQQRQLEMIEEMPIYKEADVSQEEWEKKTPEEQEAIMEQRKQEYEEKRRKYEEIRKAKRKVGPPPDQKQKRRKRTEGGPGADPQQPGVIKRRRKSKLSKEFKPSGPEAELEVMYETFMYQLRTMPGVPLQEPMLELHHNIIPIKGASTNKEEKLNGKYGHGVFDEEPDYYGKLILSQMSPRSLRTLPGLDKASRRRFLGMTDSVAPFDMNDRQRYQLMPDKDGGLLSQQLLSDFNKEIQLPPHPRIDSRLTLIKSESPDTVISSSSPEFGFGDPESIDFPALRPIDPAESFQDGKISPFVPLIQPIPIKSEVGVKLKEEEEEAEVNMIADGQIESKEKDLALVPVTKGDEMITKKLPITSGLVSPFTDPNTDQQVSVTLTLSASAAEDIGGVIAGIADLLQIAIPPTYEVRRTPSPESYKVKMTHKEQALNIHSLVKAKPKYCRHCDVVVISSGIIKKKADLPVLTKEEQESEGDDVTFCSMNCYMQFSITHQSAHAQAMELKESGNIVEHKSVESTPTTSPRNVMSALSITTTPPSGSSSANHTLPSTPTTPLLTPNFVAPKESPSPNALSPQIKFKQEEKMSRKLKRMSSMTSDPPKPVVKKWKDIRWKYWDIEISESLVKVKKHSKSEINELWCKLELYYKPKPMPEDTRDCSFCTLVGDGKPNGPGRLLNLDVDKWAHLNCSLWSSEVYETLNGALMSVDIAYKRGLTVECHRCKKVGATLSCFKVRCTNSFHLPCAQDAGCMFFQDKTILCTTHLPKGPIENELSSLVVNRRVYINRDEDRQIASMIHQEEGNHILRIGSLTLHCIGQLLPHQIQTNNFNTREYIYPVGFRTSRFYWSTRELYKRCRYICYIQDNDGRPEFAIKATETGYKDLVFRDSNPKDAWMQVFKPIEKIKRENDLVKLYPSFVTGEEMFGLTETNIVKVLESLPGTDLLKDYSFKFGRSPLIEMPLAINPTGAARTEPKMRTHFRRPHALQTSSSSRSLPSTVTGVTGDINSPYMKQFVHSKSQQYRRLKTEWKINVNLGRSRIQGLGLFAAKDLEKHTMVIEYIGDLIRNEVANRREKFYEEQNRGIYMFRIDDDYVIDATMSGGPARYINHSCAPNCVAEVVPFEKDSKIIIITNRRLSKGEELTYDYKFDFEDESHKIPCSCGAGCCRKWMN